ncbi:MAG: putative S-layer protein [archaeon]
MKKLFLGIFLILLVFGIGYAENNGFLVLSNLVNPTIVQGNTGTVTFTATNTNTTANMTLQFIIDQPVYNTNYLTASPIPSTQLNSGSSQSFSFNVITDLNDPAGTYLGTIHVVDTITTTNNATLSYSVIVQQQGPSITISELDDNGDFLISGPDDNDVSGTFIINNNGNVNLTNVQIKINATGGAFTSGSKTITFKINGNTANLNTIYSLSPISVGTSQTVSVTAIIPNNMNINTYEGDIIITTEYSGANATFPLLVRVEPPICEDGRRSNSNPVNFDEGYLKVDIDEPGDGDDFKQGGGIDIEVGVTNDDNNDMDVVVEAILYDVNEDNEIVTVESDSKQIEGDGGDENFDLTLTVPYDEDLDDSNDYVLYIKAYEDGDEDKNCEYDGVDLEFNRESHEVIVDSFTITPTVTSCGDLVNFNVNALNIGEQDENNVKVTLSNSELGLSLNSNEFDLDDYNGNDNEALKSFTFTIPNNAEEKEYLIEARVYYDDQDKSNSEYGTLTVSNCQPVEEQSLVDITQTSFSINKGSSLSIPVVITNNQNTAKTYTIEFNPEGSWADDVSETLTVNAGQTSTAYLDVTPLTSASGSQTGTVTVMLNGDVVGSEDVTVNIQTTSTTPGGTGAATYTPTSEFWDSLKSNTVFWIIGDIILVILIILVLVLIFRKR